MESTQKKLDSVWNYISHLDSLDYVYKQYAGNFKNNNETQNEDIPSSMNADHIVLFVNGRYSFARNCFV